MTKRCVVPVLGILVMTVLGSSAAVIARDRPKIVVAANSDTSALAGAIWAELVSRGFAAFLVANGGSQRVEAAGAEACVRIDSRQVEITLSSPDDEARFEREIMLRSAPDGGDSLLPRRIAEWLRVRTAIPHATVPALASSPPAVSVASAASPAGMPSAVPPAGMPSAVPPAGMASADASGTATPAVRETPRLQPPKAADGTSSRARAFVMLGGTVALTPGRLGAAGFVTGEFGFLATPIWGVHLLGSYPVTENHIDSESGDAATSRFYSAGAGLDLNLPGSWAPQIGAGIGVLHVAMDGHPNLDLGHTSGPAAVTAALPYLRAAIQKEVFAPVGMRVEALLGWATPEPTMQFVGTQVASAGHPWFMATIGLTCGLLGGSAVDR